MRIAQNEWMMVGAGKLFSAPFLSRALLIRLHDIKCSFLIYHDRTHIVTEAGNVDIAGKVQGLPRANIGHVVISKQVCESPIISIHYCPTSCSLTFEDFVKLPAKRLSFEECASNLNVFGEIAILIEPFSLSFSKRLFIVRQNLKIKKFIVEGSNYMVAGPVSITEWPYGSPIDQARMHCWRVQMHNTKSNIKYEISEHVHWSIAALDVGDGGQLDTAVYLDK